MTDLTRLLSDIRTGSRPPASGAGLTVPADSSEAQDILLKVSRSLGPVVAWKVGSSSPEAAPSAAPIHKNTVFQDGETVPATLCRYLGVESEVAFRFGRDLPDKGTPYTRSEVLDAVSSLHPAIEILDTRFEKPGSLHPLLHAADQQNHGALIAGPAFGDWESFDFTRIRVSQAIGQHDILERTLSHPAGDPLRLLVWLAGHAIRSGFPITAGTIVTTGSLTGTIWARHGVLVRTSIEGCGAVSATLA
ncbi:fumarylacetoacetate hydrolase family protein [Acetobacter sp. AN02]|uniref:2-keto-4-pentenoate hydratase n=1 Tax=Acetobacter sp. AN02 TaxID=2894186 RepID=UPI0024342492|nr:fumarylacetoacetate hydrolase family protein [Acetobacter sp. AN02]MDG6095348.1 fumarylacetoacetate hydrolase family protein [Acetobacter sp. AN02]